MQEGGDALLRVRVHGLVRRARLAQLQHPRQQQHHMRSHLVGDGRGDVLARAQRELGERGRHHGRQEEVAAHEHRAQLGRAGVGRGAALLAERGLRRIAAVGEDHRPALRLGDDRGGARLAVRPCLVAAHEGELAQALLEHRERGGHLLGAHAVLAEQPEGDAAHARRLDGGEGLQQLGHHDVAQLRVGLDDLAHEEHHVHRRGLVGVAHEVHQHGDHRARRVGELDRRAVDGRDEHAPVLGVLLAVLAVRLLHLLLEHLHDLADVAGNHERERDVERLLADVEVGRAQAAYDVHDHPLQHLGVLLAQVLQPLEHDELDVVVRLRGEQLRIRGRRRLDRGLRGGEGDQRRGALVDHRGRLRVEEGEYASDVLGLLVRVGADDLAYELEHDQLQYVAPRRHLVEVLRKVLDRAVLRRVEEHEERVALARHVRLRLEHLLDEGGAVGEQLLETLVDREAREHRVTPHEGVAVLEVVLDRRDERLEDLRLLELA
mmetsp:Transcript_20223/g.51199  ORF Transcript_20223/g.51199 Transcript_20223/m.51199 type:complete len:491 (-) Transcript_20223:435-1907(-)